MPGRYILIGTRWTYFPPFFNERLRGNHTDAKGHSLDGAPFWSCTFTALMYGINVAYLGHRPARASQDEIVGLALASGDDDLRGGATTKLMQAALKARFGKTKGQAAVGPKTIKQRLAGGEMLVAGVRSADLSDHFRRFIGNRGSLHRVAFVGFRVSGGVEQTRILDPMAIPSKARFPDPTAYAGEWFPMHDYVRAAFSDEQLWFRPGEFLDRAPRTVVRSFPVPREVIMHAGARIVGRDRRRPERRVLERTLVKEERARFDRIVAATVKDSTVEFLRIVDGPFASLFVRRSNPGLTADIPPVAPAAGPVGAGPVGAGPVGAATPDQEVDDDPLPPEILVPDDPLPPGREAPKDVRSTPIDSAIDDDPEAVGPAEEDATAIAA